MEYNTTEDLWYQYFNADGSQWFILLAVYGFRVLWSILGIVFNLGVLYITAKTKTFRGICNILLAMESALAIVLDLGYFVSFFVVLSGIKFIRYQHCFWYLIIPCTFGDMAQPVMAFTGLDRVAAVAFPLWYQQRNTRKYFAFVVSVIIGYGVFDFLLHYIDYTKTEEILLSCSTHEMGQSFLAPVLKINGLTLSAIIMVVYTFCWFFVFKHNSTSQHVSENNRTLIKSLLLVIALNLFGVFTKCAIDLCFQTFVVVNVFAKTTYSIAFSFFTITVYSVNAPVLYIVSAEYRARFDQHFPWIPKFVGKIMRTTAVEPIGTSMARPWIIINNGIGPDKNGG